MSTLIVTTLDDGGAGSLRAALAAASSNDTITFATGLAGSIDLQSGLQLATDVTILGPLAADGTPAITLNGQDGDGLVGAEPIPQMGFTILTVASGATASITGLGFADGSDDGGTVTTDDDFQGQAAAGAIVNNGTLSLTDTLFADDQATAGATSPRAFLGYPGAAAGGAILNTGTLAVSHSTFIGNSATGGDADGGGYPTPGPAAGAILNEGSLTLDGSTTFSGDSAAPGLQNGGPFYEGTTYTDYGGGSITAPAQTDTVTNLDDSGAGSLRAALAAAPSGDTIVFASGLSGSIDLQSGLQITDDLVIVAPEAVDGTPLITLDGQGGDGLLNGEPTSQQGFTILTVGAEATVDITGLGFANGSEIGGATGTGSPLNGDDAAGAILNRGMLSLVDAVFTDDQATGGYAGGSAAGAILNDNGTVRVAETSFETDAATGGDTVRDDPGSIGGDAAGAILSLYGSLALGPGVSFNVDSATTGTGYHDGNAYADYGGSGLITVACYCRGTLIATPGGEAAIETLRIGDLVATLSGGPRPIRWIGTRSYAARFAASNPDVMPVRIRAGALGPDAPRRDLLVSPRHAMLIDGMLIPAATLINGLSILQDDAPAQVDYLHLELDSHDVILAEGAPSESFVDDDSRGMFHNAHEHAVLYPDAVRRPAAYCAPRVEDGAALEGVRARLAALAWGEAPEVTGRLLGQLDLVERHRIAGWAFDADAPTRPVRLRLLDRGVVLCELVADRHRIDLEHAGLGDGCCGFDVAVPGGLDPAERHVIQVQRIADWQNLPQSPWTLEPEAVDASVPPAVALTPALGWHGRLDHADHAMVRGWAQDGGQPEVPVVLQVSCDGVALASVVANCHRPDLRDAGLGSGRHGFALAITGTLSRSKRHVIRVRRQADGAELPGSPVVLEPVTGFAAGLEREVAVAVDTVPDGAERARVRRFLLRQADRLAGIASAAQDRGDRPRALFIDIRRPVPQRDAGSRALLSHMRAMRRLGYVVSFASPDDAADPSGDAMPAADGIEHLGAQTCGSIEEVLRQQAGRFDVVYLHRAETASHYLALARRHMPRARLLYGVADLHHLRLARQAEAEQRPELQAAARRWRLVETMAALSADAVLTHSADELAVLRRLAPGVPVHRVPWDVAPHPGGAPFEARRGLAFVGSYAHAPNVDAACVLVREVMPLVWREVPGMPCLLVGSDMPPRVRALSGPGIEVLGQVANLGSVLDRVRLTVAPLRYGAGVKGKVLDSLAAGVPCAMSPVAAEGLELPATLRGLVGADPAALARIVLRLHRDEVAHRVVADAGLGLIRNGHAEAVVDAALGRALGHADRAMARVG